MLIVWGDAHTSTGSTTLSKSAKTKPIVTHSVGYLMAENDEGVTLVSDIYPKSPKEGRVVNFVPWGMILEYYELVE